MYRTNFYGQSVNLETRTTNVMFRNRVFDRLPEGPSIGFSNSWKPTDLFSGPTSRFEDTLHQEVLALKQRSSELDRRIKNVKVETLSTEEQQSLMREYSMIERTKELMALIVDNMQKCAANIAANFR